MVEDLAARLDRIESTLAIQQLPARYALALDAKDFATWADLFIDDVDCGKYGKGRAALRSAIEPSTHIFYRSIHQICGHVIDFVDENNATGSVYCRAEHEHGDKWVVMGIIYFDTYERRDGKWYFVKRKDKSFYSADVLERPQDVDFTGWEIAVPVKLPAYFPTFKEFFDKMDPEKVAKITRHPIG